MTHLSRGILAAVAISLSLGAVAWGRDLVTAPRDRAGTTESEAAINRATKTDRSAAVAAQGQTRTIVLRLDALADTSVLIRIPVAKQARKAPSGALITKSADRKLAVACEPMVSVMTEVAKLLQPGRCVT